ncbi:MFS transporter [Litorilituus sediminis]|uniref:MFS transporter n=1 Tax=Litorilituus sediminis TaxID=718192 RepID=A0A4P6P0X8_9GAMM|nr:MFS transporter [Litorilituus sediminis]QBG34836.1 MFS transporter [Litorilituus sediminis]
MSEQNTYAENDLKDVKQLGLWASILSLGYIFWLVGGMEIVERVAYYGVKASASLYATDAVSKGGLGLTMSDYGTIMFIFALTQTFVPIVLGGTADRVGYKETIAISTVIKIAAYLTMAMFPSFLGFTLGAMLLAFGTGIFKPGIQGTMVKSVKRETSTMAWGIFYQLVNIGGWLGPLIAVQLRQLSWNSLFYTCAAIISLNFILLLMYKEPGREERLAKKAKVKSGEVEQKALWRETIKEVKKPIVMGYMFAFSGFWFMFNAMFDVLPKHIEDWVNTSTIVTDLFGAGGTQNPFWIGLLGLNHEGTKVMPEYMMSVNFIMIATTCFIVAGMTAKFRILSSMLAGCILCVLAMTLAGFTPMAWAMLVAIAVFSLGEMLLSPKKGEFMGNIAPADKKAMYLGFVMLPQGIGWTLEGKLGPWLYDVYASKDLLARDYLQQLGMAADKVAAIKNGEAFDTLVAFTGKPAQVMTDTLYQANNIGMAWYIIATVGAISGVGIFLYAKWVYRLQKNISANEADGAKETTVQSL